MRIKSGSTDQHLYFVAVDSTDLKTRETGLATFTVYRSRGGGAATIFTTPTVAELSAANMPGVYSLLLDEDMTITSGKGSEEMAFHITQASMAPVTRTIELYQPANDTVAAVTGAVGSVTGAVGSVTGAVGSVTGAVGSVSTGGITASSIAADAIGASELAADAATEIAAAVLGEDVETGLTLKNALRLIAAASAGKLSGAATTTIVIKNAVADDKSRITATVDADGNRSAIVTDLT